MQLLSEFALNHWMLVTAFCVLLGLLVANTVGAIGGIDTQEAVTLINREGALVIDIRTGSLPRNPNGKIDRKCLCAEFEQMASTTK